MSEQPAGARALEQAEERGRRWRLVLGGASALRAQRREERGGDEASSDWGAGEGYEAWSEALSAEDQELDEALTELYGVGQGAELKRGASLGDSAPKETRWLGQIQRIFPQRVAQVMQRDALERLKLSATLSQPELVELIQPDVQLISQLISLASLIPDEGKEAARRLIQQVVDELIKRFREPLQASVTGSVCRHVRNPRPRHNEIDWHRTIKLNLKHYQPSLKAIIPERRVGFGRHRSQLKDVILCVDQSGSMASSVIYSSVFAAVLASLPSLKTRLVLFDTSVVDVTDELSDPTELLFGLQLGGGTHIGKALSYCAQQVTRPSETVMVLITDLYEGTSPELLFERAEALIQSGVRLICLLALSDDGQPAYHHKTAQRLASLGAPTFGCSPELFPELMGRALAGRELTEWASQRGGQPVRVEP